MIGKRFVENVILAITLVSFVGSVLVSDLSTAAFGIRLLPLILLLKVISTREPIQRVYMSDFTSFVWIICFGLLINHGDTTLSVLLYGLSAVLFGIAIFITYRHNVHMEMEQPLAKNLMISTV